MAKPKQKIKVVCKGNICYPMGAERKPSGKERQTKRIISRRKTARGKRDKQDILI